MASPSPSPSAQLATSPYPYAFAPDIIRAHQKDAYFQGLISNQLTDLHRRLLGARSAHAWSNESRTIADLIYLSLTTLLGNRTLGEEYCGLVQVEASSSPHGRRLPSIQRRAAYIAGSILLPYGITKILPSIRARIRAYLERNLSYAESAARASASPSPDGRPSPLKKKSASPTSTWTYKIQKYLLANLSMITSPAPIHAVGLALFYFSGSYYELAKRLTGLRYIFTSRSQAGDPATGEPSADRAGYELLGVLLVVQMSVQAYMHLRSSLAALSPAEEEGPHVHVSLDEHAYSASNSMLLTQMGTPGASAGQLMRVDIATVTHTPPPLANSSGEDGVRYSLVDDESMKWIKGSQQRKCTLCLEELKDPAATQCGHVFCWSCICDWVREKPECPLCRRGALVQHILPLQAF